MKNGIGKVAILSHFQSMAPSYALAVGWNERAEMLKYFGIDFTFFVAKNCPKGSFPNQESVLKTIPGSRPFEYKVDEFTKQYLELLREFDVVLTADLIYQRKGNFLAFNQAARNASTRMKAWWCHWIHSSWTERPGTLKYPDSLRYTMMPRSFLVYLNSFESRNLEDMYLCNPDEVRVVYNPKDPRLFYGMHGLSGEIIKRLKLYEKEVVCIFPHCSTRMDAKGIDGVINVNAALKRAGLTVGLVFCNANARKVQIEINQKRRYMEQKGLIEGEDYMFTHELDDYQPMPRKVIRDLFRISNLFVFTSWRETTGNAFQEAQINDCLLVLNEHLPCLQELARRDNTVWAKVSYKTPGRIDGKTGDFKRINYHPSENQYFDELVANQIIPRLKSKHYMWSFSWERIWEDQFSILLQDATKLANAVPIGKEDYDVNSFLLD